MRAEYDFSGGVRSKHAAKYGAGANIITLDPDIAAVFHDSESVNAVLRSVLKAGARAVNKLAKDHARAS